MEILSPEQEKIVKDIRNPFRLKKLNYTAITGGLLSRMT